MGLNPSGLGHLPAGEVADGRLGRVKAVQEGLYSPSCSLRSGVNSAGVPGEVPVADDQFAPREKYLVRRSVSLRGYRE